MKYKIGNVEVEAVQWKGNNFQEIANFMENKISYWDKDIESTHPYGSLRIRLGHSYSVIMIGQYIVNSNNSVFKLSEQDFNNMTTKVKEPKFRVGDAAYKVDFQDIYNININKYFISKVMPNDEYHIGQLNIQIKENRLSTLEEAIEKLKEL